MELRAVAVVLSALAAGCLSAEGDYFGHFRPKTENVLVLNNQTEPEYIDPGLAVGQPDGRVCEALFEGLTVYDPVDLHAVPGVAERWETSAGATHYTFHLRRDAKWTDGTPVTAQDFVYSWERVLNPITGARYAQMLYPVRRAELYNTGRIKRVIAAGATLSATPPWEEPRAVSAVASGQVLVVTDSNVVEVVEDVAVLDAPGPSGRTLRVLDKGAIVLRDGASVPGPAASAGAAEPSSWVRVRFLVDQDLGDVRSLIEMGEPHFDRGFVPAAAVSRVFPNVNARTVGATTPLRALPDAGAKAVDEVEGGDELFVLATNVSGDWTRVALPRRDRFGWVESARLLNPRGSLYWLKVAPEAAADARPASPPPASGWIRSDLVLATPDLIGVRATDSYTLDVDLEGPLPYFLYVTSHTVLAPVPARAVEEWGPRWTRPENIVGNGPFVLVEHSVRDRFVLSKSPTYWDRASVGLDGVVLYSIDNLSTTANMYRAGTTDLVLANDFPPPFIPTLRAKRDYSVGPALTVYFYRINTTRPPLNDPRVRLALDLATNKEDIVKIKSAGELPAAGVVPPGIPGYTAPPLPGYDPARARRLLAEAGFPGGAGFPTISILYNTNEQHKLIAAAIQAQWRDILGVHVELENKEWKTYLKAVNSMDFDLARGGWIGDYPDPNTYLELFTTGGGNNNTGWSKREYDALIRDAALESDPARRMAVLRRAEEMLIAELPVLPIYFYVWSELRKPYVKGWYPNVFDKHPWKFISVDLAEANHLAALEG